MNKGEKKLKVIKVRTKSMLPFLKRGDILFIRNINEYKVGDIIAFKLDRIYIHRIIKIYKTDKEVLYLEKGDNNINALWINNKAILGKVILVNRTFNNLLIYLNKWQFKMLNFLIAHISKVIYYIFQINKRIIKIMKIRKIVKFNKNPFYYFNYLMKQIIYSIIMIATNLIIRTFKIYIK